MLHEPVVGNAEAVAVVLNTRRHEICSRRIGDHADLGARGTAGISIGICGDDAELLDGVLGLAEHASEGVAIHLVVVVDTIDGDVALVRAAAVHGATPRVVCIYRGS